jgi:hypothetical protein
MKRRGKIKPGMDAQARPGVEVIDPKTLDAQAVSGGASLNVSPGSLQNVQVMNAVLPARDPFGGQGSVFYCSSCHNHNETLVRDPAAR